MELARPPHVGNFPTAQSVTLLWWNQIKQTDVRPSQKRMILSYLPLIGHVVYKPAPASLNIKALILVPPLVNCQEN